MNNRGELELMTIDLSTDFGTRVANRLRDEQIIWLTTNSRDQTPQPNPVWFLWTNDRVLIFSEPGTAKVSNLTRNPRVSLNFNSDSHGDKIAVITGAAAVDPNGYTEDELTAYTTKYAEGMKSLGLTTEAMVAQYSAVIRVTPEKLRGY
jgi:PPOX class probable F420-dependent enzyme